MDGPHRQAIAASRILRLQGLVKLDCMIVVEAGSGCYGSPVGGAPRRRGTRWKSGTDAQRWERPSGHIHWGDLGRRPGRDELKSEDQPTSL